MSKQLKLAIGLAITATLMGGCATTETTQRFAVAPKVVYFPAVGATAVAEVGQTLVSKGNLAIYPSIIISADQSEFIKQPFANNRHSGSIKVPAGKYVKTSENLEGDFYRAQTGFYDNAMARIPFPVGVFVPKDGKAPAVLYVYHETIGATGYEFGKSPVDYQSSTTESWSKDSFKRELVYGGMSQKTISMLYREYIDGTARPAFSQEIKYDLDEGKVIGYKGARFEVISANNTGLTFKLLKPLD